MGCDSGIISNEDFLAFVVHHLKAIGFHEDEIIAAGEALCI